MSLGPIGYGYTSTGAPRRRRRPSAPAPAPSARAVFAGSSPTTATTAPSAPSPSTIQSLLSGGSTYSPAPQTVPSSQFVDRSTRMPQTRGPRAEGPKPRVGVDVPELVPPRFRRAVAIQGQRLNSALQEAGVNMSGPEYLGRLIQFESNWDTGAEGPPIPQLNNVTAKRLGQAIPSTRDDLLNRFGVDMYGPPKQQIRGAAMHASGKHGYGALYAGYNPGYSDTDPITQPLPGRLPPPGQGLTRVRAPRQALRRTAEGQVATGSPGRRQQGGGGGRPLSIAELFHDPGVNLKHGEPTSPIGGHDRHVHAASERPRHVQRMAAIAQRMGLNVGEHPDFGGGHETGHSPTGYHPRGLALDVTGDPDTLLRYNRRLARRGGAPSTPGTGPAAVGGTGGGFAPSSGGGFAAPAPSGGGSQQGGLRDLLGGGGGGSAPFRSMLAPRPRVGDEDEDEEERTLLDLLQGLGR